MDVNQKEFQTVVLGALLHDIGKVVQRASDAPTSKKHTQWGYDWLKERVHEHPSINATIAHHYTKDDDYALNNNYGIIWYQADNLASKERKEKEKLEEASWYSEIAIASPFSRINNPRDVKEAAPLAYLPLQVDGIVKTIQTEPRYSKNDYKALLKTFEDDFENITKSAQLSVNSALMLFEKHLKYVPSITLRIYDGLSREEIKGKHPDLSLYDHSKLTAAIAGCMYNYYSNKYKSKWIKNDLIKDEILNVPHEVEPYVLIGGDISGIQSFIYTITSKGALKSLKGRSFFLELLTEHIISELLRTLCLTRCNIIFSGGGHFYILSYNTEQASLSIEKVKKQINEYLFNEFDGNLLLHLETENFHPDMFKDSSKLWSNLSVKLEQSKKKKWQHKIEEVLATRMPHGNCLTKYCEVCFREDTELNPLVRGNDQVYESICGPCSDQFNLGEALKELSGVSEPVICKFETKPNIFSIKIDNAFYLLGSAKDKLSSMEPVCVYRVNDLSASNYIHPGSTYFPVGIYQHQKFDELSKAAEIFAIDRIAVLRMDVDNLGKIFSEAVPEEDRTFSRMASISRGLNDFFKYHLNTIVRGVEKDGFEEPLDIANREIKKHGRMLTIVYSGGDDLFIVGHWLDVTEASFDIQKYFNNYTGNPYITISGGLAVNHHKYPIYQYAKAAENAEKMAKQLRDNNDGKTIKNAITLFDKRTFQWNKTTGLLNKVSLFSKFLIPQKDHLAIDEQVLPKTFFYRLLALARRFNEAGALVLPKAAYLISRIHFGKNNIKDQLRVKEVIMNVNKDEWQLTEIAAMWILMLTRKGGKE